MNRTAFLAALCAVLFSVNAEARQRHKPAGLHPSCNILWPCAAPSASTPEQARVTRGRYIARQVGFGGPVVKRGKKSAQVAPVRKQPNPTFAGSSIGHAIARPARFIAGRLVCAINVGAALAERGIKGTGSALALSYDKWGRPSGPVPGAVAVTNRAGRGKGHVAIVSRVEGSRVFVFNPGRKGWREIEYTNRGARYRVASQ